jgi:hypothetical protein
LRPGRPPPPHLGGSPVKIEGSGPVPGLHPGGGGEALQRRTTYKVSFWGGRVPLDLRFWGPLEAKSFVRGREIDPPGAAGRVFDLNRASCGHVRRCITLTWTQGQILYLSFLGASESIPRVNLC